MRRAGQSRNFCRVRATRTPTPPPGERHEVVRRRLANPEVSDSSNTVALRLPLLIVTDTVLTESLR
ncbi:hypothetical protein RHCRD62_90240 [Rhodococcus sp. RD6.2]|nr:hypothetical protein RHCRD62_90240 [Rhodococcus sp. RD6.2]